MTGLKFGRKANTFAGHSIYIIAVAFFLLFSLGPIAWSFVISITPSSEMQSGTTSIFPGAPTLENYKTLLFNSSDSQGIVFRKGLANTMKASFLSIIFGIPMAVLGAYPLARMKFKGRMIIKNGLLITMVIPVFATIIPLFKIFTVFNLIDSYTGLTMVYITSSLPLATWLISSCFESLPRELEEAAFVDGSGSFRTLVKIIIPVSYPAIFAATLIMFLYSWNQFLVPLVLSPSYETKPIAVIASEFVTKTTVKYGLMNAGGILAILPPAVIAVAFRRFLVQGLVGGATKG